MSGPPDAGPGHLQVQADLQLTVDGVPARLVGDGDVLRLETAHPFAVSRQALRAAAALPRLASHPRRTVVAVADGLAGRGLTVVWPVAGSVAVHLGAQADSPVARVALGTAHAQVVGVTGRQLLGAGVLLLVLIRWLTRRR